MSISFQETGFSFEEIKDSIFPTMVPPFEIYLQSYFWDKKILSCLIYINGLEPSYIAHIFVLIMIAIQFVGV